MESLRFWYTQLTAREHRRTHGIIPFDPHIYPTNYTRFQALPPAATSRSACSFFTSLLRNTVVSSVTVHTESNAQASKIPTSRPISFLVLKMIVRTALLTRKKGVATPYW
jgi:hypothetical protein